MSDLKGFNVLLRPATRETLKRVAEGKKWSIGQQIRDVLERWAEQQDRKDRKGA